MSSFTMGTVFEGLRLVSSLNVKDDIQALMLKQTSDSKLTQEEFGFQLLMTLLEKASAKKAEMQIYAFLSKILGSDVSADSNPDEVITELTSFADVEEWRGFFTRVWKLISQN